MKTIKPKYSPGDKVELISGSVRYINCIQIFSDFINYQVWDGESTFLNVDDWQIKKRITEDSIGYKVKLK